MTYRHDTPPPHPPVALISLRTLRVVWLNIALQTAFPLAVAFTPAVTAKSDNTHFSQPPATENMSVAPRVSIVDSEETASSAAQQYALPSTLIDTDNSSNEMRAAALAAQAGDFLKHNPHSDAAVDKVRELATGKVNEEIQQWLHGFGNARVQLHIDKHFSLQNTQFDLLIPLWEQEKNLVFSQSSLHRTDDRTQSNLGLGLRHFEPEYEVGANTFLDHDHSHDHTRMGVGLEYWCDFLKLNANAYQHLTSWKNTTGFVNDEERPANGWDLRAEGYLPAYPQLGAKLTYEQYYGNEVALFGKDSRQTDPHVMTVGVTYTPFPLLTVSAEQHQGEAGKNDTRFDLHVNYQVGAPLNKQLDGNAVAARRSLEGSRYDLVDRNNNITLAYRKQELIRLKTADLVSGDAGEQKSLGVSVTSTYGVDRIDWDAATLLARGGKIIRAAADYSVLLPDYQYGDSAVNTYTISAVAYDKQGNASSRSLTQVTVIEAAVNQLNSTFTPEESTLPADGKSTQALTLTVHDKNNLPVDVKDSEISLNVAPHRHGTAPVQVSPFKRIGVGRYQTTVTTSTHMETLRLTPTVHHVTLPSAKMRLTAGQGDAQHSSFTASPQSITADGKASSRLTFTVKDANDNLVTGLTNVTFAVNSLPDHSKAAVSTLTETNGVYTATLTGTEAGIAKVVPEIGNTPVGNLKASVTLTADDHVAQIVEGDLTVTADSALANGTATNAVQARITDIRGNPLPNQVVSFSADQGAHVTHPSATTNADGRVSTTLTSTKAGTITVTASISGAAQRIKTQFIGDSATALVADLTPSAQEVIAGGENRVTYQATIKDKNGNPLSGVPVYWQRDNPNIAFSTPHSESDAHGIATMSATSLKTGIVIVSAQTEHAGKSAKPVTFIADKAQGHISQLSVDKKEITADNLDKATFTATVQDTNGNILRGMAVSWSVSEEATVTPLQPMTDSNGQVVAQVTSTKAGELKISAYLTNGNTRTATVAGVADNRSATVRLSTEGDKTSAAANGDDEIVFQALVKDTHGNIIPHLSVAWHSTLNTLAQSVTKTDNNGVAHASIKGTHAGDASVTALLFNGNRDDKTVVFTAEEVSGKQSTLKFSPSVIVTNGSDSSVVHITARDPQGNLLTGLQGAMTLPFEPDLALTVSAFSEVAQGEYEATVSGTQAGQTRLQAKINRVVIQPPKPLTLIADPHSAKVKGTVTVTPATAVVGETVSYSATIVDGHDNPLGAGIPVTWSANDGSRLSQRHSKTDANALVGVTLTRQAAGTAKVDVALAGGTFLAPDVVFSVGEVDKNRSELSLSPNSITANGVDVATLKAVLRDKEGNLLTGQKVTARADMNGVTISAATETTEGVYLIPVQGIKAGTTEVRVFVNDADFNTAKTLTLQGDMATWKIESVKSNTTAITAGEGRVIYSAVITDKQGNPLKNVVVSWQLISGVAEFTRSSRTDGAGIAKTTLTSNVAGNVLMEAYLDTDSHKPAENVVVNAGAVDVSTSTFTIDKTTISADGKAAANLKVRLKDKQGNTIAGQSVNIESLNPLSGITATPNPMQDLGNGEYVAVVTSISKGEQALKATVGREQIGKAITVTASAITPDLRFDHAEQQAIYTKNFTQSQPVRHVPSGVRQLWSSSDPDIASVSDAGIVTLHKSGKTTITVQTTGNVHYSPAQASYMLTVDKAEPKLSVQQAHAHIVATWADSNAQSVKVIFGNGEAAGVLTPTFTSNNDSIVKANTQGALTQVKPGTTTISVTTPETEQFNAGTTTVAYTLNKAEFDIKFATMTVQTTDEITLPIQQPSTTIPADAQYHWQSSDQSVVDIGTDGEIKSLGQGKARLMLTVTPNDYYQPSSGYYDVEVYAKPRASIVGVKHISRDKKVEIINREAEYSHTAWTPVFKTDTASVTWNVDTANEYSAPASVIVQLLDINGNELDKKTYTGSFNAVTTTFEPKPDYWNKDIYFMVTARGVNNLKGESRSETISVRNLSPKEIWNSLSIQTMVGTSSLEGDQDDEDTSCKLIIGTADHNAWLEMKTLNILINGELLSPFKFQVSVRNRNIHGTTTTDWASSFDVTHSYEKSLIMYDEWAKYILDNDCWRNHAGGYGLTVSITYAGKVYIYTADKTHGWGGNGNGMYSRNTDDKWY